MYTRVGMYNIRYTSSVESILSGYVYMSVWLKAVGWVIYNVYRYMYVYVCGYGYVCGYVWVCIVTNSH